MLITHKNDIEENNINDFNFIKISIYGYYHINQQMYLEHCNSKCLKK